MRVLLIAMALLLSACGTNIYSAVSSYSAKAPPPGSTYILYPAKEGVEPADFEFAEYAAHVQRALGVKGWRRVAIGQTADMGILVDYGIGEPRQTVNTAVIPTYGQTGVSSATTTGTVSTFGRSSTVSATTTYTPQYGVTGYVPITQTATEYDRFLILYAYQLPLEPNAKPSEIWRTAVASSGSTGDLRAIVPYLAMAASPHIASNTGKALPVTLQMDGKAVKQFLAAPLE